MPNCAIVQPDVVESPDSTPIDIFNPYIGMGLVIVLVIIIFLCRLRYPCLTVSGLKTRVDDMKNAIMGNWHEEGNGDALHEFDERIRNQFFCIQQRHDQNVPRWSSLHSYVFTSFRILWMVIKCYDDLQDLEVSIKNTKHKSDDDDHASEISSSTTRTWAPLNTVHCL
ncbi:hypothetical protein VKT23_004651 [Stygiomarasmius scandens]|uniref:ATP synthase F0 subunit 8 n=1 Tax=Marasmiellus scandens TaxID=2682957 RepID=A0ABR1JZ82_9AGAR